MKLHTIPTRILFITLYNNAQSHTHTQLEWKRRAAAGNAMHDIFILYCMPTTLPYNKQPQLDRRCYRRLRYPEYKVSRAFFLQYYFFEMPDRRLLAAFVVCYNYLLHPRRSLLL